MSVKRSIEEIIADLETCETYVVFARTTMEAVFRPTPQQRAEMLRRANLYRELCENDEPVDLGVPVLNPYGKERIGTLMVVF